MCCFFFSSRRRHTRCSRDWSSDVCSSDLNGLAAVDPVEKGEGLARGPYPIGGDLEIDGAKLSRLPGQSELVEQAYDFASGELTSRFRFRSGETTATVEVLTFCSRSLPTVVLQDVQ